MRFWRLGVLVALLALVGAGTAAAGPPIDWANAFAWLPAGVTVTNSPAGSEWKEVGIINAFDSPFGDLNANDPNKEYTFYAHGLLSTGTDATNAPLYLTNYTGGTIEIYCDDIPPAKDASFDPNPPNAGVPGDFTNGTLILSGNFTSFFTQTNSIGSSGNLEGEITWTGGTLLSRTLNANGQPCTGLFTGGLAWGSRAGIPAGYLFKHDGKIDLNCPVPVESSTWGRIKGLYQ